MKKLSFLFIGVIFLLVFCHKKAEVDNRIYPPLSYYKTELGGCNVQREVTGRDTLTISLKNDTLNMLVGLNYECNRAFAADCQIKNDTLIASLTDTCTSLTRSRCVCILLISSFQIRVKNNILIK